MTDDLLNIPVTPADQQLAARLGLASIDGDSDRYVQVMAEIIAGGLPCAIAVLSVTNNHLASGMATHLGVAAARSVFERTILDAPQASDD